MTTTTKMNAKKALSNLKGTLSLAKAAVIANKRDGIDSANAEKQVEVYKYAVAAVESLKLRGKSAFKELARAKGETSGS